MRAVVDRSVFYDELGFIRRIIPRGAVVPELAYVRIEAVGGDVVLTGTDLETVVRVRCEADVQRGGVVCCRAGTLYEVIGRCGEGEVVVEGDEGHVVVRSGRARFRLSGLHPDDFPQVCGVPGGLRFRVPLREFGIALGRVVWSALRERLGSPLEGVLMEWWGLSGMSSVRMVATDRHRLSMCEVGECGRVEEVGKVIVSRRAAEELLRIVKRGGCDVVECDWDENRVYFRVGVRELVARLVSGGFPGYGEIISLGYGHRVVVGVEDFRGALSRVLAMLEVRDRGVMGVRVRLGMDEVVLSVGLGDEEAEDRVSVHGGESRGVEFAVNGLYLLDFLGVINERFVEVSVDDPVKPIRLRPICDVSSGVGVVVRHDYFVMPMRLVCVTLVESRF